MDIKINSDSSQRRPIDQPGKTFVKLSSGLRLHNKTTQDTNNNDATKVKLSQAAKDAFAMNTQTNTTSTETAAKRTPQT
ncbi:hypothetical protein [Candidatus Magnetomonas plexicatena]|uniref:hypothetical protein n=1 Tax=Candidatus Magnetomonas plexicatena TaxID=2552947 RepID=UPI0011036922|nr:hypothetical protein E2O03_002720 [Nitrospirales bacterium LBB_01]